MGTAQTQIVDPEIEFEEMHDDEEHPEFPGSSDFVRTSLIHGTVEAGQDLDALQGVRILLPRRLSPRPWTTTSTESCRGMVNATAAAAAALRCCIRCIGGASEPETGLVQPGQPPVPIPLLLLELQPGAHGVRDCPEGFQRLSAMCLTDAQGIVREDGAEGSRWDGAVHELPKLLWLPREEE